MKRDHALILLCAFLAGSSWSSALAAEQEGAAPAAAHTWENVPVILVPSPPGATPTKQWRLQALNDDSSLYLKFTYPDSLPPVGRNLANSFEPTSKTLNQLPFVKIFVPPESLSKYEERPKATLPDGTKIDFAQVGDPKPQFEVHAGFFLRSKAPNGQQSVTSGGEFDRKDLVEGYQSVVIGIQGYVKCLKQGGKRIDYSFEGGDEPSQFVIEESAFILIVPLADGKAEDGTAIEPFLSKPLPDLSLRVFPSGSNHFKPYRPKRISAAMEQAGAGKPATAPESKPEGGDKPQPESGGRSRQRVPGL